MKIIAFTGLPRSGKDTAADWLEMHGYLRAQFSEPLKAAAAILLNRPLSEMQGLNGFDREAVMPEWGFSVRHFLQVFGTECLRQQVRDDFWVQRMRNKIAGLDRVVITDLRFENEAALVRELGGVVVGIDRPGLVPSGHASDAGVVVDTVIPNDGTLPEFAHKIGLLLKAYHAPTAREPAPEQP